MCAPISALISDLSDGAFRLLGLITYRIGQNGYCWASQASFADDLRCSVRTAQRRQDELVDGGFITVENRGNQTNLYRLANTTPVSNMTPVSGKTSVNTTPVSGAVRHHCRTEEETKNKNQEQLLLVTSGNQYTPRPTTKPGPSEAARKRQKIEALDAEFEVWWKQYPRKVAKVTARAAYRKARTKAEAEEITAGLRRALPELMQREPHLIAHPTTWLNGERWNDEVMQPLKVAAARRAERATNWMELRR